MIKEYVRFTDIVDIYTNILKNNYKGNIEDWSVCINFIAKRSFEIFEHIYNIINKNKGITADYNNLKSAWYKQNKEMLFTEAIYNINKYYELTSIKYVYSDDEFEKLFNYSFYKGVLIEFQVFVISEYYNTIEVLACNDIDCGAFDDYLKKQLETDYYLPI